MRRTLQVRRADWHRPNLPRPEVLCLQNGGLPYHDPMWALQGGQKCRGRLVEAVTGHLRQIFGRVGKVERRHLDVARGRNPECEQGHARTQAKACRVDGGETDHRGPGVAWRVATCSPEGIDTRMS